MPRTAIVKSNGLRQCVPMAWIDRMCVRKGSGCMNRGGSSIRRRSDAAIHPTDAKAAFKFGYARPIGSCIDMKQHLAFSQADPRVRQSDWNGPSDRRWMVDALS